MKVYIDEDQSEERSRNLSSNIVFKFVLKQSYLSCEIRFPTRNDTPKVQQLFVRELARLSFRLRSRNSVFLNSEVQPCTGSNREESSRKRCNLAATNTDPLEFAGERFRTFRIMCFLCAPLILSSQNTEIA